MSCKQEQSCNSSYSNQLMELLLDILGHEVTVETRDGSKYEGIFAATQELKIGLKQVHKVEPDKLLPHKNDVLEKMIFGCDDYVCVSAVLQDEKPKIRGFATDREYRARRAAEDGFSENTFEPWNADESVDIEESKNDDLANGGWSADDMFHVNKALGVESTYVENMSQYTNAPVVEKDSEDRLRADKIAREIEQDRTSRAHAVLENDDEERDLDKPTLEYQFQNHRRNLSTNRSSYGNTSRGGLSGNPGPGRTGPQSGRRGDVPLNPGRGGKRERFPDSEGNIKRERFPDSKLRGRGGSYSSTGSRSFTNSALSHGGKGSGGSLTGNAYGRYQVSIERPSAQVVHNEFSQFEMQQTGGDGTAASASNGPKFAERRPNHSESVQPTARLVHETGHRSTRHNTNSPHNRSGGDDVRNTTRVESPHTTGRTQTNTLIRASSSSSASLPMVPKAKHIVELQNFQKKFQITYPSTQASQRHSASEENQGNVNSSSSTTVPTNTVQQPVNAWTKGPPLSIRSPLNQSAQLNSGAKEPTPAESLTQNTASERVHSLQKSREEGSCIQTGSSNPPVTQNVSVPLASAMPLTATTESSVRASGSDSSSPPSSQSMIGVLGSLQQMTITTSNACTPVLSANGSSSSIAPVDPQPSVNSSVSNISGATSTPQTSSSKKFEFNPDAAPFTPRFATQTPTPRSTPAPVPATAVHAAHPVHQLSMNPTQGLSVAQGLPSGVIAQSAPPFSFNPNAGVYSPLPLYYGTQSVLPMGTQIAQVSASPAAAGVTGGPIVTGSASISAGRTGQVAGSTPGTRRTQLIPCGSVYISNAVPYAPQTIPQYPINVFAAASPFQQISMGSASVPPPSLPPPSSSAVAVGATPQPLQLLQALFEFHKTQQQHPQAAYTTRQYYQSTQSYLVAAPAPRGYAPHHQNVDYNGGGQQPSSAASSNGNGSNGHNSQPATPGPQPIASPSQVAYPSSTNTPQPAHPVLMPMPSGPPHHSQHMYVQPPSAQFPFVPNTGYMVYNPQQMMQLSAISSAAPMGLNQASQAVTMDHYQGVNESHGANQHNSINQTHGSIPSQQYLNAEQSYGQYVHGGN